MTTGSTATETFRFLRDHPSCVVERWQFQSREFDQIRESVFSCLQLLLSGDDDSSHNLAARLRMHLSDWLTAPVPFEQMASALDDFLSEASGDRFGRDVKANLENARSIAEELKTHESPIRLKLIELLQTFSEGTFKIFCHRSSAHHYESLAFHAPVSVKSHFLHGLKDYRETKPFGTLIKVGPMRASGWGAIPDAVLSAPRQQEVIQVLWSGCADEPGFPYDAIPSPRLYRPSRTELKPWSSGRADRVKESQPAPIIVDELQQFYLERSQSERRKAVLVHISTEFGIAYPPHAMLVVFDPNNSERPICELEAGSELQEGMYLVRPLLGHVDLGGVQAQHGHFSRQWKRKLEDELGKSPAELVRRLRDAGLQLVHLRSALEHWSRPPSTVIHAPQQIRHFQILMEVLGMRFEAAPAARRGPAHPWWLYAWDEIRRSRGEAIQAGFQEQDIVNEQLIAILNKLLPRITSEAQTSAEFVISMPATQALEGSVHFNRVLDVDEGLLLPESHLRLVDELRHFDQWRV